jgi:hypothetical protein
MNAYILIIAIMANGAAVESVKFDTKEACVGAAVAVQEDLDIAGFITRTVCVPAGDV